MRREDTEGTSKVPKRLKKGKNKYSKAAMAKEYQYYAIYKPYGILSQFTDEGRYKGLSYFFEFSKDVYPIGRLDADSEGLLLLTNDNALKTQLLDPDYAHERTYWVQVEGTPKSEDLLPFEKGIEIKIKKKNYLTQPAKASLIAAPSLPERSPPIRFRANIPTAWLEITLTEGKNRQIRRMTAKIGFPTLRLVRVRMAGIHLEKRRVGECWEIDKAMITGHSTP